MKEKFIELFEYNHDCNKKLIECISENIHNMSEKTLKLFNHVMNAQQIWNARIYQEQEFEVWQINDWNEIALINEQNHSRTLTIIHHNNIDKVINYKNSRGQSFSNLIEDMLFHIINHSTYHRAQIATEMRNQGFEPMNTDYIFYKRNNTL